MKKVFNPFRPDHQFRKEIKQKESKKINRRDFLKLAGGTLVLFYFKNHLLKLADYLTQKENLLKSNNQEQTEINEIKSEIEKQDEQETIKILDYSEKDIEINEEKMIQLKNYWKLRYQQDEKLKNSLKIALKRISPWLPYLKKIFKKYQLPENYCYLAIPESHFNLYAKSSAGAYGPYQLLKTTAQKYDLIVNSSIDERFDPIKSAEACARNLKDLYLITKDWNLAFSGYNGGYIWKYIKTAKKQNQPISYKNFLKFLEKKVNDIKEKIDNNELVHLVKKGDNLFKLSKLYKVSIEEIKKVNKLKSNIIFFGQQLKIPLNNLESKKSAFYFLTKGIRENLNYPPKFYAVLELIEKEKIKTKPIKFLTIKVQKQKFIFYKVGKGKYENIFRISKRFNISQKDLMEANNLKNHIIKTGQVLKIPKKLTTLESLAKIYKKDINFLKQLNPSITNPSAILPEGFKVRI